MVRLAIVCGAGAVGCGARYLVSVWAGRQFGTSFPYGTLIVNVAGSFLIALVMESSIRAADFSPNLRLALTTGLMGGFTTYSSFNYETTTLMMGDAPMRGALNIVVTVLGCLGAGLLGLWLARRIV
ncbi:MAG: fluoride efflux transporter CrcB [Kofleriaceae bacterium]|nr:fluoride efflux transporter CrcB [Kofleriaceae bacterium]